MRERCPSFPLSLTLSWSRVRGERKPSVCSSSPRIACLAAPTGTTSVEAWKPAACVIVIALGVTERSSAVQPLSVYVLLIWLGLNTIVRAPSAEEERRILGPSLWFVISAFQMGVPLAVEPSYTSNLALGLSEPLP